MEPVHMRGVREDVAARFDEETRAKMVRELRDALDDLLDAWFPRVIDREHGGFLCDFDHRWKPTGPHRKMLEFQARQTRLAVIAAEFLPERADLRAAAEHGISYLRDVMWDGELGGFYRLLDRAGSPLEDGSKHGHGTAYALSACAAHHRLTGSADSLDLTKRGFDWMERHAHDDRNGGYFGYYRRDGRLILDKADSPSDYQLWDPIGTPLGLKDVNTTKDLMETMGQLAGVWPDDRVLERMREMVEVVCTRVVSPPGSCHMYFNDDWTPVPHHAHYGHNLHTASLLLYMVDSLGGDMKEKAEATARALLECALEYAWDPVKGGFAYAGSTFGRVYLENQTWFVAEKYWWPQAESLVGLVRLARMDGPGFYSERALALWHYIRTYLIDRRYGGWYRLGLDGGEEAREQPKADVWRDGSHEGMALIKCIRSLTGTDARVS